MLPPCEPVSAGNRFCFRGREQDGYVIAAFRMAGSEDLSSARLSQEPFERDVSATPKVRCISIACDGQTSGLLANRPKSRRRRNFAITIALASLCNCKKC